jgi:nucleoside 2-deoxyribosyltransferase
MKLAICSSTFFEREILKVAERLRGMGHKVITPFLNERIIGKERHDILKQEKDLIRFYFQKIKTIDAILVTNFDKNGIEGYVGGNTLMEMGFAYVLHKPIFLLYEIPDLSYRLEIEAMKPIILNGNLEEINKYQKILA